MNYKVGFIVSSLVLVALIIGAVMIESSNKELDKNVKFYKHKSDAYFALTAAMLQANADNVYYVEAVTKKMNEITNASLAIGEPLKTDSLARMPLRFEKIVPVDSTGKVQKSE